MKTFEEAWAEMEAKGYRYGADALEHVRFGWELRESAEREGGRACRNFSPWNTTEDQYGERVDPRSCFICGMFEHEHARVADALAHSTEDEG